jgi:hypothetical protein
MYEGSDREIVLGLGSQLGCKRNEGKRVFKLAENGTIYGYQNMGVYFSF